MEITHLSLFSGVGGLDLAAEWAGIQTVGQCEWAKYPTKVLERHWPDVPRWKDIKTLTGESFYERTGRRTVDIISGGFPCQPFSVAGKQRGKKDDRYLWPEMVRVIKELRPAWVVGENVTGIIRLALTDILSDLEACGYRARTFLIPACAVGARHRRYRVAIVGYSEHNGLSSTAVSRISQKAGRGQQEGKKKEEPGFVGSSEDVSNTNNGCRYVRRNGKFPTVEKAEGTGRNIGGRAQEHEPGERRPTESILGGMADGISGWMDGDLDFIINHYWDDEPEIPRIAAEIEHRVDRLKCLGNAVVPQQFYPVFKAIEKVEEMIV